jgi:proteasome lid subunit RPN8/RPN11
VTSRTESSLVLERDVAASILDHAREGAAAAPPEEVCGVLGGRRAGREEGTSGDDGAPGADDPSDADGDGAETDTVTATEPVPNVADDPRREYELDPAGTVATIDRLESAGLDVVGFYHSHPESDPVPSRTDERRATWPGYVYLICNPDGRLNAYRWTGEAFDRLSLARTD